MAREVGDRISRDRVITLTDAVLAIVMTLLVLEIVVPQLSQSEVANELPLHVFNVLVQIQQSSPNSVVPCVLVLPLFHECS